jgi:hypothetical protein
LHLASANKVEAVGANQSNGDVEDLGDYRPKVAVGRGFGPLPRPLDPPAYGRRVDVLELGDLAVTHTLNAGFDGGDGVRVTSTGFQVCDCCAGAFVSKRCGVFC